MSRKKELLKVFESIDEDLKKVVTPLVDDVVFLEGQLEELRKLPFIRFNPHNPHLQKTTPACKQYKELLQQYNNCIKILCGVIGKNGDAETSPLQEYLKTLGGKHDY